MNSSVNSAQKTLNVKYQNLNSWLGDPEDSTPFYCILWCCMVLYGITMALYDIPLVLYVTVWYGKYGMALHMIWYGILYGMALHGMSLHN